MNAAGAAKPVTVVAVGDTPTGVIGTLAQRPGRLRIVRRCPELAELLAACQNGLAQAAVVAAGADDLSATLVDRLAAVGVTVVAVADTPEQAQRLRGMGAAPVTEQVTAELLGQVVAAAVASRRRLDAAGYAVPGMAPQDPRPAREKYDGASPAPAATGVPRRGPVPDAAHRDGAAEGTAAAPDFAGTGGRGLADGPESEGQEGQEGPDAAAPDEPAGKKPAGRQPPGLWAKLRRKPRGDARTLESAEPSAMQAAELDAEPQSTPPAAPVPRPKAAATKAAAEATTPNEPGSPGASTLVAVWGPIGSPGRTTVAINLAAEQAAAGKSVMVIDADSYGASIAAALGLLEESASFAQACRAADQGSLTGTQFASIATKVVFSGGTFSLLTGLTRPDRWPELRSAAVARVLELAMAHAQLVVVDCGFSLENDEELSYDTVAPRRNGATLAVLARADIVYAVGGGDPVGIPRLIRGMHELRQAFPAARVEVVVNKVRRRAAGRAPEKALAQAWERFGPGEPIAHFLPWDPELTDRALLEGRLLLEIAPDAPLRRGIRGIDCAAVQRNAERAVTRATAQLQNQG